MNTAWTWVKPAPRLSSFLLFDRVCPFRYSDIYDTPRYPSRRPCILPMLVLERIVASPRPMHSTGPCVGVVQHRLPAHRLCWPRTVILAACISQWHPSNLLAYHGFSGINLSAFLGSDSASSARRSAHKFVPTTRSTTRSMSSPISITSSVEIVLRSLWQTRHLPVTWASFHYRHAYFVRHTP